MSSPVHAFREESLSATLFCRKREKLFRVRVGNGARDEEGVGEEEELFQAGQAQQTKSSRSQQCTRGAAEDSQEARHRQGQHHQPQVAEEAGEHESSHFLLLLTRRLCQTGAITAHIEDIMMGRINEDRGQTASSSMKVLKHTPVEKPAPKKKRGF